MIDFHEEQVDRYIELLFGKPDYTKSFTRRGIRFTPFNNAKLYRIDIDQSIFSLTLKRDII
jgi:hypothetical protein